MYRADLLILMKLLCVIKDMKSCVPSSPYRTKAFYTGIPS